MRNEYERKLEQLNADLTEMSDRCSRAVIKAVESLQERNVQKAQEVLDGEQLINALEKSIAQQAVLLLLKETPVASDLRFVSSALRMNTDLERIGDQAEDISLLVQQMLQVEANIPEDDSLTQMANVARDMIQDAVVAFKEGDADRARSAALRDDEVDALFLKVRDSLIEEIRRGELDPAVMIDLIMIAKYMERIGDHAQNIAEAVLYSLTGKQTKFD